MSSYDENQTPELAMRAYGVAGPVGNPKPLPKADFQMEPDKGNLGGPGNAVANAGVGAELPEEERP